jgi:hypothetical protein
MAVYEEGTLASIIENRLRPRMTITLPARMVTARGVMEGETENVSLHGAFIRCQKPLEPGERLIVIVKLPSNPSFNSHAEVVWSRVPRADDEGIGRGMGVKFID